jgi:serine/threonine protein kinase
MIGEHRYIGKEIGNYTIVAILASGGFGTVYKAQHKLLKERFVAIKFLHAYLPKFGAN